MYKHIKWLMLQLSVLRIGLVTYKMRENMECIYTISKNQRMNNVCHAF